MTRTPTSSASERSYIGAVLMGYTRAADSGLRADDFADPFCSRVFALCLSLEAQGKTADLVTVGDADEDVRELIQLTCETTTDAALHKQHAENIRSASHRRQFISVCAEAAKMAQDGAQSLETTIHLTRSAIDAVGAFTASQDAVSGTDALVEFNDWLYAENPEPPIPTGLGSLDRNLGDGLQGGKMVVVGARPAVGKSALLSKMALGAIKRGKRVLYVSLEMSPREIVSRMMSSLACVSAAKMEARTLDEAEHARLIESYALFRGDNLLVSTAAVTPSQVRRAALKARAKGGLDMVCVDYLQLMHADGKTGGRTEEVGEISRALKLLAMELGCPVVTAAQVNRASTQGEDRAPRLSELRESGSIEQDADVVILLHKPQGGERIGGSCALQLYVAKNRQGKCGIHDLTFYGDHMRFAEVDNRYDGR